MKSKLIHCPLLSNNSPFNVLHFLWFFHNNYFEVAFSHVFSIFVADGSRIFIVFFFEMLNLDYTTYFSMQLS